MIPGMDTLNRLISELERLGKERLQKPELPTYKPTPQNLQDKMMENL